MDDKDADNTESAISEELSHLSSPAESQSSSCTSIFNPFYDGPSNETPEEKQPSSSRRNLSSGRRCEDGCRLQQGRAEEQNTNMRSQTMEEVKAEPRVIVVWDLGYLITGPGFLQLLQCIFSIATLSSLASAGSRDGGLLNLPLSWHFRIMIFVLVLTLLVTSSLLLGNVTSLISIFGFEWTFFDMVVYALFAFLYLVGSSLVASAFDFYEKMNTDVSKETIQQLVTSVILGYICMVLNGLTALLSYRKWKVQYRLYQRRKLIEEDEIDL